jgi:hypothetical protein
MTENFQKNRTPVVTLLKKMEIFLMKNRFKIEQLRPDFENVSHEILQEKRNCLWAKN